MKKKLLALGLTLAIGTTLLTGCESSERFWKGIDSEMDGLDRKVEVILDGKVFRTYEGKFDVNANESRVKFIDDDGHLIILYRSQFDMIIVEEK